MRKFTRLLCTLLLLCAVGVANAADFKDVIINGDLNGTDLQCFAVNDFPSGSGTAAHAVRVITDPVDASNKCIVVRTNADYVNEWDAQFFVMLPADQADLEVGDEIKLTMRVRAEAAQSADSQSHGQGAGAYNHWAAVGSPSLGTTWNTFSGSATVSGDMSKEGNKMRVIAFNLSKIKAGNICYFDDIKLEVKRAKKLTDIKLNVARNPYCEDEDATNFVGKDGDAGGAFSTNFVEGKGVGGSKGIVVRSIDNPTEGWDTQFFITLHRKLYAGDSFRLKFSYRADQKATAGTQSHGAPGDYIFWSGIGNIDFTTEWKTFDKLVNVTADMANKSGQPYGFQTIAFNLNDFKTANNYYFDNIFIYFDEEDATNADKKLAAEIAAASGGEEDDPNVDPALVAQAKERLFDAIQAAEAGKKAGASAYRSNVLQSTIDQANMLIDMDNATVSWVNNMILRLQSATATQMDADPQPSGVDIPEPTYKGLKADLKKEVDAAQAVLDANQSKPEKQKNSLSLLINQANTILVTNYDSMDPEEFEDFINLTIKRLQDAEKALKEAKEESTEPDTPTTTDNRIWLYNVGAKKLIAGGNDWGTRASIVEAPMYFTPEISGDGKYTLWSAPIYTRDGNDTWLGTDGYVDNYNGGQRYWTIEPVEGKEGVVTMSNGNGAYLFWNGGETTTTSMGAMPETAENGQWKMMKKADLEAFFADATPDNPVNATFYITNPNFSRCTWGNGWEMSSDNQNLCNGNNDNMVAESYHAEFTLSQTIKVVDGKYMLKAQGAYRQDGGDNENLPEFYANQVTRKFPKMGDNLGSMWGASTAFSNGQYEIEPIIVDVVGGELTIGCRLKGNTNLWCIWDNFRLYNLGDPDISAEKGAWLAMMNKLRNVISGGYDEGLGKEKVHRPGCKEILAISSYQIGREEFEQLVKNAEENILDQVSTNINTIQATIDELIAARVAFQAANKPLVEPGKNYIKNVASGKWWGCGNDWGTHASLVDHPSYVVLDMPGSYYTMETQVNNSGTQYFFEGEWMDNANAKHLTIEDKGKYFLISADGKYYGYNGVDTYLGRGQDMVDPESENALWQIFSEDQMKAELANASVVNPVDATWLIMDPSFSRNQRNKDKWKTSEGVKISDSQFNNQANAQYSCAERYKSDFSIQQELVDLPAGLYSLTAQGFYRVEQGGDGDILPVFFANDQKAEFPERQGEENTMIMAGQSFASGMYKIDPIFVEVTDGKLNIGASLTGNANLWSVFDNFELTYYGPDATIDEAKNSSVFTELAKLIEQAQDLEHQMEVKKVQEALTAAIKQGKAAKTLEEANAAIPVLKEAVGAGEASLQAKNVLPKMKELVDNNNIVTAEAYEEYYGQWVAKYEAGTLTKADVSALQDPSVLTGWHASITCDDYLLSAWDAEPDFQSPYYINTWSVEGDKDGTNFHVPFIEYWTGDDNSLGEKTMTAAIDGVPAGKYTVEAWVRVRMKNSGAAPTYGISMQANGSNPVDVCDGEQSTDGSSTFFNKVYQIPVTVGSDGALTVSFDIASDNNVSWLAIKNVRYFDPTATAIKTVDTNKAKGAIFNLQGQRVNKATKGVFIQDGKIILKK